jgi:starch synthase
VRILFATAELRPLVSTGGLGEAAAGLVASLRRAGHEVEVVLPDYLEWELSDVEAIELDVPAWAQPITVRRGHHELAGPITVVNGPGIVRPNPYVDEDGRGYADNDLRFAAFSVAVARLIDRNQPDVVQLNDWHTGLVPAFVSSSKPTVLTIHNLAHQGWANAGWLHELPARRREFARFDAINVLAGAIRSVEAVVAVSPNYAREIVTAEGGMGLDDVLRDRGDSLLGIRNGIDTTTWDPSADPEIPVSYSRSDLKGKAKARAALLARAGWGDADPRLPLVVMVTRLVGQKGVDLAFEAARFLPTMRARLLVLGSGERHLADWGHHLAAQDPDHVWFSDGFDVPLSHLLFAGGDLYLMPSRFEPCGLAQMQAMTYGTIPLVTPVGGLVDTVIDADARRDRGTGFVAGSVDTAGVVDLLHRGLNGWRNTFRRRAIIKRDMEPDWSWDGPAAGFVDLYQRLQG